MDRMILSDMCVCHDDNLLYNTITYHFLYIKSIYCLLTHHHLLLLYFQNTRAYCADQCLHVQLRRHELQSIVEKEIDTSGEEKHDQISIVSCSS